MFDWLMQASALLATQGYSSPHEQMLIGFVAGAMLVNPVVYALVKTTGFFTRLVSAPFEARARRVRNDRQKDRQIARLERRINDLSTSWTSAIKGIDEVDDLEEDMLVLEDEPLVFGGIDSALKSSWGLEAARDLKAYHNVDVRTPKYSTPRTSTGTLPCGINSKYEEGTGSYDRLNPSERREVG